MEMHVAIPRIFLHVAVRGDVHVLRYAALYVYLCLDVHSNVYSLGCFFMSILIEMERHKPRVVISSQFSLVDVRTNSNLKAFQKRPILLFRLCLNSLVLANLWVRGLWECKSRLFSHFWHFGYLFHGMAIEIALIIIHVFTHMHT